jgi:hypothetical protein
MAEIAVVLGGPLDGAIVRLDDIVVRQIGSDRRRDRLAVSDLEPKQTRRVLARAYELARLVCTAPDCDQVNYVFFPVHGRGD